MSNNVLVKMCPDEYVGIHIDLQHPVWCDRKLQCGRCIGNAGEIHRCNTHKKRKPFESTVDCDSCKNRFICYTSNDFGEI